MEEFPTVNESFGILNDLENSLVNKDNFNYNTSFNQARIEDITFMEYDMVPSTLRNHLENDLEPLNPELLQELLGASDFHTDLEVMLQRPFNEGVVPIDRRESDLVLDQSSQQMIIELDKRTTDISNENLNGNALIEGSFFKSNRDADRELNNIVNGHIVEETVKVKSSQAIEEIEHCRFENNIEMIELEYPLTKRSRLSNKFVTFQVNPIVPPRRPIKRKPAGRPLIVDNVTTISHQLIRDNMNKINFCLVDKNSLFPNALVSRSLKAQIVCSAINLLEFPGNTDLLRSHKLLSFWMKRKNICQNIKSPICADENIVTTNVNIPDVVMPDAVVPDAVVTDTVIPTVLVTTERENPNEISDISIEKGRGQDSSRRTTLMMDSFNMGSDSLQKSIIQNSFEADKTMEDINIQLALEESAVHPVDVSMLPIIEEDIAQKPEEQWLGTTDMTIMDKSGVWRIIKDKFKEKLDNSQYGGEETEVRVSFYELCPRGSLKKNAAIFMITLLRLAKYRKIRLFQAKYDADIFVGLPLRDNV